MYGLLNSKMELWRMTFCDKANKRYIATILIAGRKSWTAAEDVLSFSPIMSNTKNTLSTIEHVNFNGSSKISNLDYKNSLLISICLSSSRLLSNLISHHVSCTRVSLEQWQFAQKFRECPLANGVQNSESVFRTIPNTAAVGSSVRK
jgi:hypothetical protein